MSEELSLDGRTLGIEDVVDVARKGRKVALSEEARARVEDGRTVVKAYTEGKGAIYGITSAEKLPQIRMLIDRIEENGRVAYGITTGFGELANVKIPPEDVVRLQYNLIRSHAAGVGDPLPEDVVRAAMLIRANTLATGRSGVRPIVIEKILEFLNSNIVPVIPSQGSVGASGDLAPTAHMALALIGEGEVFFQGVRMSSMEAMKTAGLTPLELKAKEGLALINGTQVMTAIAALAVHDAEILYRNAVLAAAMSIEALWGTDRTLDPKIHQARPHPGQMRTAAAMRKLLEGSGIMAAHANCDRVQDAYSLRCSPQVMGASADAIEYVRSVVEREMNSATDNPLVFAETGEVLSNGNFHGEPIALAMDFLGIAVAELANISERRSARLVDPHLSGLPPFLIENSGLNSGFMIAQYTAASLVSENKVLAHPASVDSIPTSANQEDHVSMGTTAARKAMDIIRNSQSVIAVELLLASQALELHKEAQPAPATGKALERIRRVVPFMESDRAIHADMEKIRDMVASGKLVSDIVEVLPHDG